MAHNRHNSRFNAVYEKKKKKIRTVTFPCGLRGTADKLISNLNAIS